jgi:hypothetical protein
MSKKIEVSAEVIEAVHARIHANFSTIIAECDANPKFAKTAAKFRKEQRKYTRDFVAHLCEVKQLSDANFYDFMLRNDQSQNRIAIYALEKVTKLLRAITDKFAFSKCDKYTRAMIANARKTDNAISNFDSRASITRDLKVSDDSRFSMRLHYADSTASTQRSSSAYALHCLKLATYNKNEKLVTFDKSAANYALTRKLFASMSDTEASEAIAEDSELITE